MCLTCGCHVLQRAGSCSWWLGSWIHLHPVSSVFQPSTYFRVCTGNIGDGMQLYWCGETPAAERHAITCSWWSWLISPADLWNCSRFSVGTNIPSVRLASSATYAEHLRVAMHRVRLYGVCGSSKAIDHIRNWNAFQTSNFVPEVPSRLSGFRALASYDRCKHGSVRLVLWCQFSRVVELLLNRKPCPWDMRNLEIEVWMSVQCCYNQGRRSLSNQGYELICDFILFVMSIEWMAKDSIKPCIKYIVFKNFIITFFVLITR